MRYEGCLSKRRFRCDEPDAPIVVASALSFAAVSSAAWSEEARCVEYEIQVSPVPRRRRPADVLLREESVPENEADCVERAVRAVLERAASRHEFVAAPPRLR